MNMETKQSNISSDTFAVAAKEIVHSNNAIRSIRPLNPILSVFINIISIMILCER